MPSLTTKALTYSLVTPATLVLLLSVSAAIVARSYIIRRRQRRAVEEAIRNGTYVPGLYGFGMDGGGFGGRGEGGGNGARRGVGKRPGLFDVFLEMPGWEGEGDADSAVDMEKAKMGFGAVDWGNVMVSVIFILLFVCYGRWC